LVLPNIINPFYAELAASIGDQASERGYELLVCSSGEDQAREALHLRTLHQRRVDGGLVVASGDSPLQRSPSRLPFPCIFVDRAAPGRPSVTTDNRLGGRLALEHLLSLGHRDIAVIIGDEHVPNIQDRLAGAYEALDQAGVKLSPRNVLRGSQSIDTGREAHRLWSMGRPPTAVFATNDVVALGVWQSCLADGVRIPEDVSLVGFDDIHWASLTVPPLTTIRQDVPAMAATALELLLAAIAGTPLADETSLITPKVMVRGSTGMAGGRE
jgi:LacI family transcriptional regulator